MKSRNEYRGDTFFRHGIQTGNDVSQAFTIGQLGKCHDTKIVAAFESLYVTVAMIPVDTSLKASPRKAIHDLSEDEFSVIH